MSHWPDKYVIGLTGNIATGKSVVRKMLEHLGAYSIDADSLANRAIAKDAPAYQPVVDIFGSWILDVNREIDRKKLGQLVFNAPDALRQLEEIVHPYVGQAINLLVKRSKHDVIIIEAIKLLEGDLASQCDSIWVVDASKFLQLTRLMERQNLSEADAKQRIKAQGPQKDKIEAADIVINNTGSFEGLWKQVVAGWGEIALDRVEDAPAQIVRESKGGYLSVQRGHPRNSEEIAALMTRLGKTKMNASDVMAAFGEKAFFLLQLDQKLVGLAGWQVENLITRTTDLYVNADISPAEGLKALVEEIEKASKSLQSEASLLFLNAQFAAEESILKNLGYEKRTPKSLGIQAWQEAGEEKPYPDSTLFFKQLRIDRVLRPI